MRTDLLGLMDCGQQANRRIPGVNGSALRNPHALSPWLHTPKKSQQQWSLLTSLLGTSLQWAVLGNQKANL